MSPCLKAYPPKVNIRLETVLLRGRILRERAQRQLAEGEAQAWHERGGDRRKPPVPQPCPLIRGNYSGARDPRAGLVRRARGTPNK